MSYVPIFRSEMSYTDMEKRQLFLRSYHFSRKKSLSDKIKVSFFRVKKVIRIRLRSAKKIRKIVWFKLKHSFLFFTSGNKRFLPLRYRKNSYNCLC
ncbi:hypothetical protein DCAR_0103454 [Daucus carota subsp. sativus]|uniref:Uncharacterized protein n=1 Tax=Daucus carota subsp. sativus TaxID=79200 RepID=A0AAF1AL79_DAUCS|nr:hypothetical protein DCAR_0103454 [Daucus carota subsp. sativus]